MSPCLSSRSASGMLYNLGSEYCVKELFLSFPWGLHWSSGPQPWLCLSYAAALPVPGHAPKHNHSLLLPLLHWLSFLSGCGTLLVTVALPSEHWSAGSPWHHSALCLGITNHTFAGHIPALCLSCYHANLLAHLPLWSSWYGTYSEIIALTYTFKNHGFLSSTL